MTANTATRPSTKASGRKKAPPVEPAADSLLTYLDHQVLELRDRLEAAIAGNTASVHKTRVATRRLKAGLDLVAWVTSPKGRKRLNRLGRTVRRALGPVRDADVLLGHLADRSGEPTLESGVAWIAGHVRRQQEDDRHVAADSMDVAKLLRQLGARWYVLRPEIAATAEAFESLIAESVGLQIDTFSDAAKSLARSLATSQADPIRETTRSVEAGSLDIHALRIAGKHLRYTLEIAAAEGASLPPAVFKTFKSMQEALGSWHDEAVLAERALAASLEAGLMYADLATQQAVLRLALDATTRSDKALTRFVRLWSKHGEQLVAICRETFPITGAFPSDHRGSGRRFSGSTADRDPHDSDESEPPVTSGPTVPPDA